MSRFALGVCSLLVSCFLLILASAPLAHAEDEDAVYERAVQIQQKIHALRKAAEELKASGKMEAAQEQFARAQAMQQEFETWLYVTQAEQKAEGLMRKARELESEGKADDAAELREKAQHLLAELEQKSKAKKSKEKKGEPDEREMILGGLEKAIVALKRLGGQEELIEQLVKVARAVKQGEHPAARAKKSKGESGKHGERGEQAGKEIRIIKMGVGILVEADRTDLAETLERAAHARELKLSGRSDAEAREILRAAPQLGQLAEVLGFAAEKAHAIGKPDAAELLGHLSRHYLELLEKGGRASKRKEERAKPKALPVPDGELGLLRAAVKGLLEGDQQAAAEQVERAEAWRRLAAKGAAASEIRSARRAAPTPAELARHLRLAARLWHRFGQEALGQALLAYANKLAPAPSGEAARRPMAMERERLEEAMEQIDALRVELERVRQDLDR